MTTQTQLTRDEILAMPAGREMDALVAERLFGWQRIYEKPDDFYDDCWKVGEAYAGDEDLKHYSTYISAAWEVVEKFRAIIMHKWAFSDRPHGCTIENGDGEQVFAYAQTVPLAICRAALLTTIITAG